MKPNKETEFNEFIKWSENLCDKRHNKLVELRKEKCGNNFFKKWFYLGKKVKATYAIEKYYSTPYDKLRWKAFKKWWKKIEKHGLEIKRPYMYYGKDTYNIWNSHLEYKHGYKKFSSYWWRELFEYILEIPKYHYKTCWYDYYDLFQSLIVKLTIKGLALGLFGNAVTHKEQMHEIWECRKELIKAYNFDDYYELNHFKSLIKEKFGIDYETALYDKYEYLNRGRIVTNINANVGISPLVVEKALNTQDRNLVYAKCKEIDEYCFQNQVFEGQAKDRKTISEKAFKLLAEGIYEWWD